MTTFLIGDMHVGHIGVTHFLKSDGTKLRPWDNIEDMNEALINNWNNIVSDNDRVFVLGDFAINRKWIHLAGVLNGKKTLICGNHETGKMTDYTQYFHDIKGAVEWDKYILTHIPVHPAQIYPVGRYEANIHGHLHDERVMLPDNRIDPRYVCVSAEQINFTPIAWDEVKKIATHQREGILT